MTTEPSPEQFAPQQDTGWAFTPRPPADGGPQHAAHRYDGDPFVHPAGAGPAGGRATAGAAAHGGATPGVTTAGVTTAGLTTAGVTTAVAEPPYAAAAPPPGHGADRRPGRRKAVRIVLALVVLAAAVGAVAVARHRADATPSASKHLSPVWHVRSPAADDELIGSWLTPKLLIRASTRGGVTAYDLSDGDTVWTAALPPNATKGGTLPCAMSPTLTAKGLGTVAFGKDGSSCTSLAGIDTATGTVLWTVPLVDAAHPTAMGARTYLQGNVATIVSENFLGGLDVRSGHRVWGFAARAHYCNAYDWGDAGIVLVDDYCADAKSPFTLTAYDGKTGKPLWSRKQSAHSDVAHVFSGSPLIASVHTAGEDSVRVFTPKGDSRKLEVGDTELAPGNDSDADHSARLIGNVLITPAQTVGVAEIDAFDTATGARLWSYPATALATDAAGEGRVFALAGPTDSPQLIELDPHTGRATAVSALPPAAGSARFTAGTVYVTPDGGVLELDAQGTGDGVRFSR